MIEFQHIGKAYKNQTVLKDINFTINDGEFVCFIGPSGCGKTTTLKMMNMLITPSEGKVLINGKNITDVNPVQLRRTMGYVIQQTGLFPHLTVRENIELISRLEKKKPKELLDRTKELMEIVGLDAKLYMDQYPIQLSGGQQQRVGVARALARNPEIILMDEPFSALDPITRSQLQDELLSLQESVKKTIVFVTHDMEEAVKMADRICIMQDGHIAQFDTPEKIMKHPSNEFVQSFVGKNRIWDSPELIHANDIMIENPVTCPSNATIMQAIGIMQRKNVDTVLLVSPNKKFLGVVDGLTAMHQSDKMRPAKDILKEEMYTVSPEESIVDILLRSKEENIYTVPVVKDGLLKGLITKSTLVTALSQKYESEGEEDDG